MKKTHCKRNRFFDGAGNEARTRYLHLGKVALYRMSYARISKGYITTNHWIVKKIFQQGVSVPSEKTLGKDRVR